MRAVQQCRMRRTGRLGPAARWSAPTVPAGLVLVALLTLVGVLLPGGLTPPAGATATAGTTTTAGSTTTAETTTTADPCVAAGGDGGFRPDDRLVMTYLYYWYDADSLDQPGLALHPPADQPFDWRDPDWHRRQLADMAEVGVDVALAVYWGDGPAWSTRGLEALVAARESLLAEGASPPAIGLFLDTNLFAALLRENPALADLTGEAGRKALADQIASFFDRVPACHQARVDGRPLVFLWRPDTEDDDILRFDAETFDALYARLEDRLGVRPYIVRERTWDVRAGRAGIALETDGAFEWGAALKGPRFEGRTVAVGPGYDDRLVPGRPGYQRDRRGGDVYARDLRAAVLSGASWLLLETWNELWEATAIAETAEHGRAYLDITRRYARLFRQLGDDHPLDGSVDLGSRQGDYLGWLTDAWQDFGTWAIAGRRAGASPLVEPGDEVGYFHFAVPARLKGAELGPVEVLVEYFDEGEGSFQIEYDSDDPDAPRQGSFKRTPPVAFEGSGQWRWHTFVLPDPRFARRQYRGYGDFRIRDLPADGASSHVFGRVIVRTKPEPRPVLLGPETLTVPDRSSAAPVHLHWREVEGAAGYVVQLGPVGVAGPGAHGYSGADRGRCAADGVWPWEWSAAAVVTEPSCRLGQLRSAPAGLYRWRVLGVDESGSQVGEPSNWGYLLVED